jgi:DNA-binding PadR family transcriptional regulator
MPDPTIDNLILELRRGTLVLSVLSQLYEAQYGYALKQRLADKGLDIDQGTLYPLLRRLEKQGLLDSEWSVETSRPRRYYVLSDMGESVLQTLVEEWHAIVQVTNRLLAPNLSDSCATCEQSLSELGRLDSDLSRLGQISEGGQ